MLAAYAPAPASARPVRPAPPTAAEAVDRAAQHGDEHVIKLADTAADAYAWSGDTRALSAVVAAAEQIDPAST